MYINLNKETWKKLRLVSNEKKIHAAVIVEKIVTEYFEANSYEEILTLLKNGGDAQ